MSNTKIAKDFFCASFPKYFCFYSLVLVFFPHSFVFSARCLAFVFQSVYLRAGHSSACIVEPSVNERIYNNCAHLNGKTRRRRLTVVFKGVSNELEATQKRLVVNVKERLLKSVKLVDVISRSRKIGTICNRSGT